MTKQEITLKNAKKWQKGEKAINPDFIFGNFSRRGGSIGIKPGQKVGPKIYSFLKKLHESNNYFLSLHRIRFSFKV